MRHPSAKPANATIAKRITSDKNSPIMFPGSGELALTRLRADFPGSGTSNPEQIEREPENPVERGSEQTREMAHKISSTANPLIRMLKGLHAKKERTETGLFLAEGARLAREAADLNIWPEVMAVSEAALERPQVRDLAAA